MSFINTSGRIKKLEITWSVGFFHFINDLLHGLKSFCVTSSISYIVHAVLASSPLTPELLEISSPDSFYECSSPLRLVLKWVLLAPWLLYVWEGGIRRTQQLFHHLKILWSRWTCRDWAEPREGGNQDVWPNKNQFIDFCSGYSHLMSVQAKPSFSDVPVSLFFSFYSCSNWI